jgi:hypothetical protein
MSGIFISYRREDSAAYAGRLYDRLCARFGANRVFMDVDDISPGADFATQIGAKIASCDALIAVIGKDWLTALNGNGRLRLTDPNDFVGLEVASALRRGILVIPALVGGAVMPKPEELRDDLRQLARKNAVTLHDDNFPRDAEIVIQALENLPALRKKPERTESVSWERRRDRLWKRLLWKVPLILLLVSFAVWWQWRQEQTDQTTHGSAPAEISRMAKAINGTWQGEVNYDWGAKYTERFFFQSEGDKLFGTASFLGTKRGIEDGKLESDGFSFFTRFQQMLGSAITEHRNRYWGKVVNGEIRLRIQDDRGNLPVEIKLTKGQESG